MENFYQIFQKQLRMERGFFIKRNMVGVAAVYFSVLKCLEACVGSIVSFQFAVGLVLRLIVFDQPDVGISSPVEYRFESQRYRSAVGQVAKT